MCSILDNMQKTLFSHFTQASDKDLSQIPSKWYTKENILMLQTSLITWINTERSLVNANNVGKLFDYFYQYMYKLSNEYFVAGVPNSDVIFDDTFDKKPDMNLDTFYRSPKDALKEVTHDKDLKNRDDCLAQLQKCQRGSLLIESVDYDKQVASYRPLTVNDFMAYTSHYLKALKK